jgi:exopolysaccharide biosynthesis polyprenyl glycosylphosphotransferase
VNQTKTSSSPAHALPTEDSVATKNLAYELESTLTALPTVAPNSASRAGRRSVFLHRLLLAADFISAILAGAVTSLIFSLGLSDAAILTGAMIVGSIGIAFVFGLYSESDLSTWASGLHDAPRSVVSCVVLTWPIFAVAVALDFPHAALVALVSSAAAACFDSTSRALARGYAHRVSPLRQRTVIVGSGIVADRLADRLERHGEFGLETIGLVDDDVYRTEGESERLPTLGALAQLDKVLEEREVDRVIIAFSRATHQQLLSCIRVCRDHRVAVDVVPRLFELLDGAQSLNQIGGLPLLSIGVQPLGTFARLAKRALDIGVSVALLVILSPLLLLTALAIKLTSSGPVFFKQVRVGRGDSEFHLYKFRSMYVDAEERKNELDEANEAKDDVMFKIRRDPRITRVGGLIRRTSIDELPQLLNVVKGEMSLVGPRPLIIKEARAAGPAWHARRLDLRPGITGLWQISGRSDLPFQEMVRFDYQYVSGWSLARDVEILLATIPVVLSGRGAY